jgi:hypothetical protein
MSMTGGEAITIVAQHRGQDDLFKAWTRITSVIATRYPREQVEKSCATAIGREP